MTDLSKPFATERTKYLRTTILSKMDAWAVEKIEDFGCAIITVGSECKDDFGWTYSLGIYDTCQQPELITVGLPTEVAKSCINEVARRMRAGADLTKQRQKELIGNVDCELRLVAPKWVARLMNFANWYNNGAEYPVLQVIYPDLQNQFQWEEGFNTRFVQPLLQPGTPITAVDHQFWNSIGKDEERFPGWVFPDKPHTKVFVSSAIREIKEWITLVTHDLSDGAWQMVGDTGTESGGPELACLHHMIEKDPTLLEIADLPKGWGAERSVPGQPWHRFECPDEEEAAESKDSETGN